MVWMESRAVMYLPKELEDDVDSEFLSQKTVMQKNEKNERIAEERSDVDFPLSFLETGLLALKQFEGNKNNTRSSAPGRKAIFTGSQH